MWQAVLIGIGGFAGAVSRYAVSRGMERLLGSRFPFGTLTVNLTGSFLLGLLYGVGTTASAIWYLCGVGFMGAFTTFSTFKSESVQLAARREWARFIMYLGITYSLGLGFAYAGYLLTV